LGHDTRRDGHPHPQQVAARRAVMSAVRPAWTPWPLDSHGGARLSSFLIQSGTLLCMDDASTVTHGDLLVVDGRIAAIGPDVSDALAALPGGRAAQTFDASNMFVLPGFIHGHLHLCQTLFRGTAEQADLLHWLRESIWPMEAAHTDASLTASAELGIAQLVAGGVTCINDMGTVHHTAAIGRVLEATGLRAVFGKALMDQGDGVPAGLRDSTANAIDESVELAERFHGAADGRLAVSLAPRFILSCSDALWDEVRRVSDERGLIVHTHLSESPGEGQAVQAAVKTTAPRYFARRQVLGPRFVAAHGVWLDENEFDLLSRADAALVHCPSANFKLGSGLADVREWIDRGIRCGLGADGAPCNNNFDTFDEMRLASHVSRVARPGRHLSAREVMALATREGARALGMLDRVGTLEVGKRADIAAVSHTGLHQAPHATHDPYTTIVQSSRASDVRLTMVDGRVLYESGTWKTLDVDRVLTDAVREGRQLFARFRTAGAA
jgi:5-methylthioadenosine/S-adenosylhomocysteine deaminase